MKDYTVLMKPWHQVSAGAAAPLDETIIDMDMDGRAEAHMAERFAAANTGLRQELLGRIHAQSPEFFEQLIVDVLLVMGYGRHRHSMSRRLGRRGDGGIDGIIEQDELSLDVIYLQAKRYKLNSPVPLADVRDFAGSLEAHHALRGVFMATSHFSKAAREFVGQIGRRIILVDGIRLAELMIRHNIGVKIKESFCFKALDADYFVAGSARSRREETASASTQPRR